MILPGDKKKGAAMMIIRRMKGSPDDMSPDMGKMQPKPMSEDGAEEDSEMGLNSAVDELMNAIERKDRGGVKSALKAFMEMCSGEEE